MVHPDGELIAYLRGGLDPAARARVDQHLVACPHCREALDGSRAVFEALQTSIPSPPPVAWPRYRAELRRRLHRRQDRSWTWWRRPLPLALATGLASVLLYLAMQGSPGGRDEGFAFEEAAFGQRLDLLEQYSVVERLDLLENLDVIRQLDTLRDSREG
jgi:predicted anti-sigma-YlaC factor YlaD